MELDDWEPWSDTGLWWCSEQTGGGVSSLSSEEFLKKHNEVMNVCGALTTLQVVRAVLLNINKKVPSQKSSVLTVDRLKQP